MELTNGEQAANGLEGFDIDQLIALPDVPEAGATGDGGLADSAAVLYFCPEHPGEDNCICRGLMGEWDLPAPPIEQDSNLAEPDYSRFQDYIPGFHQPEKPCDYCRSRNLYCYMRSGETSCKPCTNLFRECSLTNSNTLESSNYVNNPTGHFLDTLHPVDEDSCREQGTFTGIKPLISKTGGGGTSTPTRSDDHPGSNKRNGIRFPRHAVKILRDWLDANQAHPYPTEEEKAELERKTELKPSQVANWLANARRRAKATQRARPKVPMSPSVRPSTPAIDIPELEKPWEELNPLERWKNSPPENEPAALPDIVNAVESSGFADEVGSPSSYETTRHHKGSSNGSGFSHSKPASTTSFETSHGSSLSASSAARSHGSSHGSFGSFSSSLAGKKDRRRRRRNVPAQSKKPMDDKKRIFQCTFCTDTFKSKYDWTRHEKSLHLSCEKWICAPLGPFITDAASGKKTCVYCGLQPSSSEAAKDHGEVHNHRSCEEKGIEARTFFRKDHLRQHLRLMHNCEMTPAMETWRMTAVHINSRCGFCAQRFNVWQDRVDHLTAHFKAGARMSQWKGCRGLDPAVAAQVTNAMPPYLIGIEAASPNPFSATSRNTNPFVPATGQDIAHEPEKNPATTDHQGGPGEFVDYGNSGNSKTTFWEVLTVKLGEYANEMAAKNTVVSDEMLQSRARQIVYGSDDAWNQTPADNPEWLDLFKKSHGLDFIPKIIGGQGAQVPEDLETYTDLGLRIPFAVQLQAYNQAQIDNRQSLDSMPSPYEPTPEQCAQQFKNLYSQLSSANLLHDEDHRCAHAECAKNVLDTRAFENGNVEKRWCSYELLQYKSTSPAPTLNGQNAHARTRDSPALNSLDHPATDACAWLAHDAALATARAGTSRLSAAQSGEISHSIRQLESPALGRLSPERQEESDRSRALANGLQTLINLEAAEVDDHYGPNGIPPRQEKGRHVYVRRHMYELPPHRAQRFATLTGRWEDSGKMPIVRRTDQGAGVEGEDPGETSTGAMMEFLGGNLGSELHFARDASTSPISLDRTQPTQPKPQPQPTQAHHLQGQERARVETQEGFSLPSTAADAGAQLRATEPGDSFDVLGAMDLWVDTGNLMHDLDDMIGAGGGGGGLGDTGSLNINTVEGLDVSSGAGVTAGASGGDASDGAGADVAMSDAGELDDLNFDSVFDFDGLAGDYGNEAGSGL